MLGYVNNPGAFDLVFTVFLFTITVEITYSAFLGMGIFVDLPLRRTITEIILGYRAIRNHA